VVFWYGGPKAEVTALAGTPPVPVPRCQAFAAKLLAEVDDGQNSVVWVRRSEAPAAAATLHSAAAVRFRPRKPTWIVALKFERDRPLQADDLRLLNAAGRLLYKHNQHTRHYQQLQESLFGLLGCLTAMIDARDSYTAGHSERVSRIAVRIGQQMGLAAHLVADLRLAGLLHDVGKIGVRDEVLLKPGSLTPEETAHIREHVVIGDGILAHVRQFERLRPGVRHHHERYDGQGYPDRLAGEAIPLQARVLAVADACDAMMSPRRYRAALTPPQIDKVFRQHAGTQWDPAVVEHFMACRQDVYPPIYQKGIGESALHAIGHVVEALKDASSAYYPVFDEGDG
jgi:HD-GYP domain-containing protein (c-di-GMP phosphodiesterase class II)